MNENFEDRLDAALNAAQPTSEDAELNELLPIAAQLRASEPARPSPEGTRRGRARMLAELSALRGATVATPSWRERWSRWWSGFAAPTQPARRLALAGSFLLALILCNGALGASATSLPGDPLHELKVMREQVQLALTPNEQARESLREEFAQERARELQTVQQMRRVVRAELEGTVERIGEGTLTVSGVTLKATSDALNVLPTLKVGDKVNVLVQTNSDGTSEAIRITLAAAAATSTPSRTPTATLAPASATPRASDTPTSTPTRTPQNTAEPTETREASKTPKPTETRAADETREPTKTPEPTRTREATKTPEPTETREPTKTPQPTQTREPTKTQEPTQTREATKTPEPAQTSEATRTPEPTRTPKPENTPQPTRTSEPQK